MKLDYGKVGWFFTLPISILLFIVCVLYLYNLWSTKEYIEAAVEKYSTAIAGVIFSIFGFIIFLLEINP